MATKLSERFYKKFIDEPQAEPFAASVLTEITSEDFKNCSLLEMSMSARLGELFTIELTFENDKELADPTTVLGRPMTLTATMMDRHGFEQHFNGIIVHLSQEGWNTKTHRTRTVYKAVLKPALWLLTQTNDCKIFQEKSVPDILQEILDEYSGINYELILNNSYDPREYCVQYRESDFNFVSRLMQETGIYYYFTHELGEHKLILTDSASGHSELWQSNIEVFPPSNLSPRPDYCLTNWTYEKRIRTGSFTFNGYDFEQPRTEVCQTAIIDRGHDYSDYEVFGYDSNLHKKEDFYAKTLAEAADTDAQLCLGAGVILDAQPGAMFTLGGHPVPEQNIPYVITEIELYFKTTGNSTKTKTSAEFSCGIGCVDNDIQFRNLHKARKGIVRGPQSALVVGPSGEEIYVDEYGRIKVQFYWDRYGNKDQNSSCYVRVSQGWAGAGWGAQFLPRIGQEVIVEFLEGDPDRPVVTGRLYNADNMYPYSLPANKTQSGIKSRSTPGGSPSNFNEIRMEDKMGEEELYIQAEKDENILVKHCKTETVGVDETIDIGNDRTETVGHNETITVKNDRTESVLNNETLSVAVNRVRNVGSNETVSVGSNRTHTVGINEAIAIGVAQEIAVGGMQAIEIGGLQSLDVGLNQSVSVGSDQDTEIGKNQSVKVGKDRVVEVGENDDLKVGKDLVIEAGDSLTLKCGRASIVLKKNGTIQIKGKDLSLSASGKISAKASRDVTIKGSKVKAN